MAENLAALAPLRGYPMPIPEGRAVRGVTGEAAINLPPPVRGATANTMDRLAR